MDPAPFQFSLLSPPTRPVATPRAPEQARQLARVTGRIGESVMAFCRSRVGQTFRAADLAAFVMADCGGAPASADRVMRHLRAQGFIDVQLVDRAGSLYAVRAAGAGEHVTGP
jgi:hypothetical protein